MASERNRILELAEYFTSLGIDLNLFTTKARGNKGIFIHNNNGQCRIDISQNTDDKQALSVMLHEFAHFVHCQYDKSMNSLDFIFGELTEDIKEELIHITLQKIPKESISPLFRTKKEINIEIHKLANEIRTKYKNFKLSENCKEIEKNFSNPLKYLLKYDRIKYFDKIYSVDKLTTDFKNITTIEKDYIILKSKQRIVKRINSKINRLNNYYSSYNELFARFIELYYTDFIKANKIAPILCKKMQNSNIKEFKQVEKILINN